jgi:hypothetical protein
MTEHLPPPVSRYFELEARYEYTTDIAGCEEIGPDHHVVTGRLTGNFPGAPPTSGGTSPSAVAGSSGW